MPSIVRSLLGGLSLLAGITSVSASRESLNKFVATDGVVYATEESLRAAFDGARDYTVMMLMTSESGRVDCGFCRVLGPDFRSVASSYDAQLKRDPEADRKLYFIQAEPENALETFKALGLSHVPNLAVYEPTKSRSEAKQGIHGPRSFLSFTGTGDQKQVLLNNLKRYGFHIELEKPFPLAAMLKTLATVALVGAGLLLFRNQVMRVWQAKQIWLAFSLMLVIMFISGHMFNVTRGTPFMGHDGQNVRMIEPGFSSQVAAETQIMAVVYAVLSFTAIGLLKFVPSMSSTAAQSAGAVFGAVLIYVTYSVLLNIFEIKMGPFPLCLLPFKLV